jgi:hypothetical protein
MKLYQKVLTAVAAVGLTTAAAFPYVKGYIDSLPKHLTTEQAGKLYLEAVCPINKNAKYLDSLRTKYNKEMNTQYYIGSAAMDYANQRVAQLELRMKLATETYAKAEIAASKKFNNPKLVWPEVVAKDVKAYSTLLFTDGGLLLNENFEASDKLSDKNLPSKIRQGLNLSTIGKGCN